MKLSIQLENLLQWGVPRMTEEGEEMFRQMLEDAIKSVVVQAFDDRELVAFNVDKMLNTRG